MSNHFRKQLKRADIFESLKNQDVIYAIRSYGVSHSVAINCETYFKKYAGVPITSTDAPSATTYMSLIQLKANKNSPAHTFDKISVCVQRRWFLIAHIMMQRPLFISILPKNPSTVTKQTERKKPAHAHAQKQVHVFISEKNMCGIIRTGRRIYLESECAKRSLNENAADVVTCGKKNLYLILYSITHLYVHCVQCSPFLECHCFKI